MGVNLVEEGLNLSTPAGIVEASTTLPRAMTEAEVTAISLRALPEMQKKLVPLLPRKAPLLAMPVKRSLSTLLRRHDCRNHKAIGCF